MALLFAEGFDTYGNGTGGRTAMLNSGLYSVVDSYWQPDNGNSRTGDYSLGCAPFSEKVFQRNFNPSGNVLGLAVGIYFDVAPAGIGGFSIRNGSTQIAAVRFNTDGTIQLRAGGTSPSYGGTIVATSVAGVATLAAWHHMELKMVRDDVVGELILKWNGQDLLHATNLNLGTVNPNNMRGHTRWGIHIDDLIGYDGSGDTNTDFVGPARCVTVFPAGDTAEADWTKTGSVTGYGAIDEVPADGDTSFISAPNVGDVSEFTFAELPPEVENINAIYAPVIAKLSASGIGSIKTSLISGTDEEVGFNGPLTPAYLARPGVFTVDPATDTPWTKESFEAAKFRVERTA